MLITNQLKKKTVIYYYHRWKSKLIVFLCNTAGEKEKDKCWLYNKNGT